MSRKNPDLMGNWPWRYYLYMVAGFCAAVMALLLGYGWQDPRPPKAK